MTTRRPYIPHGRITPTRTAALLARARTGTAALLARARTGTAALLAALLARARTGTAALLAAHVIGDDPHDGPPDAATRPAPLDDLSAGYDGRSTLLCAAIAVLSMLLLVLGGCSVVPLGPPREAPAAVWASCPPVVEAKRIDVDALTLRIAELERWYALCRHAALEPRR